MKVILLFGFLSVLGFSCTPIQEGIFNSTEILSSSGEKIYINTLNWGVTSDSQMSTITKLKKKGMHRSDTTNIIYGLEPFIYTFENDSLTLFFENKITYFVTENFNSINVEYKVLNSKYYKTIKNMAYRNDRYYCVPRFETTDYPQDIPSAPAEKRE